MSGAGEDARHAAVQHPPQRHGRLAAWSVAAPSRLRQTLRLHTSYEALSVMVLWLAVDASNIKYKHFFTIFLIAVSVFNVMSFSFF